MAVAVLGFAIVSPALRSDWSGDDAHYSALRGILGADRISLAQAMRHSFDLWFFGNGRFYPGLIVEKYLVFYAFPNLIAYKAFLIATTLVTVEIFRRCVALYVTRAFANLAALIVVTLFAERGYHDSILAYNAMPQCVAIAMLASLITFRRLLREGGATMAFASVACYAAAALTYEDVYTLCLLYPALALLGGKSRRETLFAALPYVAVAGALTIFSVVMRVAVRLPPDSGYAAGWNPSAIAATATNQIVAALPLSYWFFDPSGIYGRSGVHDFLRNAPVSPLLFAASCAAGWFAVRAAAREARGIATLLWIGAMVAVLPALPIALTLKYQHELRPGLGYLPVFFEVFGVALIGAALANAIAHRFPSRAVVAALAVGIAVGGTMTQAANVRLVREGLPSLAARTALERQLRSGLIAGLPDGATLTTAADFDWIAFDDDGPDGISTRGLFYADAGKRIDLVKPAARAAYVLRYDAPAQRWSIAPGVNDPGDHHARLHPPG